ncbi:hypothetical protein LINPERPRIM_LOCUS17697 [Linum perenne]
MLRSSKGN